MRSARQVTWIRDRKERERCTRALSPRRVVSKTYTKIISDAMLCYYYNNKAGREVIVNFTCFSSSGNIRFFTIQQRSFSLVATLHVSNRCPMKNKGTLCTMWTGCLITAVWDWKGINNSLLVEKNYNNKLEIQAHFEYKCIFIYVNMLIKWFEPSIWLQCWFPYFHYAAVVKWKRLYEWDISTIVI